MRSLISIIIPVYKVEKYLAQCLDSVLAQTHKDIEVILVDDGSPDKCHEICDDYARRDNRIRVIHKENAGLSAARNSGIAIAQGDYIGFVDSDDLISPNMYEILYGLSQQHNADVVSCLNTNNLSDLYIGSFADIPHSSVTVVSSNVLEDYTRRGFNSVWRRLYTKQVLCNKQFVVGAYDEDFLFSFQVMRDCKRWVTVSLPLYYWNLGPVSLSRSSLKNLHTPIENIYEEYLQEGNNPTITKNMLLRILQYQYRLVTRACRFGFNDNEIEKEYYKVEKEFVANLRKNLMGIVRSPLYRMIDVIQLLIMSINLPLYKKLYKNSRNHD